MFIALEGEGLVSGHVYGDEEEANEEVGDWKVWDWQEESDLCKALGSARLGPPGASILGEGGVRGCGWVSGEWGVVTPAPSFTSLRQQRRSVAGGANGGGRVLEPTWSFLAFLGLRPGLQEGCHAQEILLADPREARAAGGGSPSPGVGPGDGVDGQLPPVWCPQNPGAACMGSRGAGVGRGPGLGQKRPPRC